MEMQFEAKVLHTIRKFSLLEPSDRVFLSVSGGPDSMALLHFFNTLRSCLSLKLFCIHINHGIRGEEGDLDASFTAEEAHRLGIPVRVLSFDVPAFAARKKISLEEAGRKVRYALLRRHARILGATRIATGHTLDDQVETYLMRIIRGTGPLGLAGIQPKREDLFIRPFLEVSKEEIMAFLSSREILWRHDSSNTCERFFRNRVRHDLLPLLEQQYNPSIRVRLDEMCQIVKSEEEVMELLAGALYRKMAIKKAGTVSFECRALQSLPRALQRRMVRKAVGEMRGSLVNLSFRAVEPVVDSLTGHGGMTLIMPGGLIARRGYHHLSFSIKKETGEIVEKVEYPAAMPGVTEIEALHIRLTARRVDFVPQRFSPSRWEIYIDSGKVCLPLKIRTRKQGDRFSPLGMTGTRTLKEFLIDEKVPREERDSLPILADGKDRIIWIPGFRMDGTFRITCHTREVIYCTAEAVSELR